MSRRREAALRRKSVRQDRSFRHRSVSESAHVKKVGLERAEDGAIAQWAEQNGFTIVSKDTDFYQRSIAFGQPPKFIWLRGGNCATNLITNLLRSRYALIREFVENKADRVLVLERLT